MKVDLDKQIQTYAKWLADSRDSQLSVLEPAPNPRRPWRRSYAWAAVAACLILVAVGGALVFAGDGTSPSEVVSDESGDSAEVGPLIEAQDAGMVSVPLVVGSGPATGIGSDGSALLVASTPEPSPEQWRDASSTLVVVSPDSGEAAPVAEVDATLAVGLADDGTIWSAGFRSGVVTRIANDGTVRQVTLPPAPGFAGIDGEFLPNQLRVSESSVWVSTARGAIAQLDASTGDIVRVVDDVASPSDIFADGTGLWIADDARGLLHVDEHGTVSTISQLELSGGGRLAASQLVVDDSDAWVLGNVVDRNAPTTSPVGPGEVLTDTRMIVRLDRSDPEVLEVLPIPPGDSHHLTESSGGPLLLNPGLRTWILLSTGQEGTLEQWDTDDIVGVVPVAGQVVAIGSEQSLYLLRPSTGQAQVVAIHWS